MPEEGRHSAETKGSLLSKTLYDVLKYIALIFLPALNTLWLALAPVWELPNVDKVALTIAAVDAFLGLLLKLDKSKYDEERRATELPRLQRALVKDSAGALLAYPGNREMPFLLDLDKTPEEIVNSETVTFVVKPQQTKQP